jgi:hypothetical protein
MENEIYEEIPNLEIGKDVPPIAAKRIVIESAGLKDVKSKLGKDFGKKVVLLCRHPDKTEAIHIDSIRYAKGDELKKSALWYKLDEDGKIAKNSAFGSLLEFLKVTSVTGLKGIQADTVTDENGYLVIKAY